MTGDASNGRVTTRELYEKLGEMERRIMAELKPLSAMIPRVERNEEEIEKLRTRSNKMDVVTGAFAALAAAIAGFLGTR